MKKFKKKKPLKSSYFTKETNWREREQGRRKKKKKKEHEEEEEEGKEYLSLN